MILFPATAAYLTSPCKGEVDRKAVGWGSAIEARKTPTRLAELVIGRRFAPTRWLADLPLAGGTDGVGRP